MNPLKVSVTITLGEISHTMTPAEARELRDTLVEMFPVKDKVVYPDLPETTRTPLYPGSPGLPYIYWGDNTSSPNTPHLEYCSCSVQDIENFFRGGDSSESTVTAAPTRPFRRETGSWSYKHLNA